MQGGSLKRSVGGFGPTTSPGLPRLRAILCWQRDALQRRTITYRRVVQGLSLHSRFS